MLKWILAAAAVVLVVLVALPDTRWLLLTQLRMQMQQPNALRAFLRDLGVKDAIAEGPEPANYGAAAVKAAARSPKDYEIQLAAALMSNAADPVASLRALERRFPDRPSVYAQTMRYACLRQVRVSRNEDYFPSTSPPTNSPFKPKPPVPADLTAFLAVSAHGERLDPQNGFFPSLAAVAFFGLHRDPEALAALHRAAGKPRWDDYAMDEARGRWKLEEAVNGRAQAVQRTALAAAILFPHYAQLRAAARVAMAIAMQDEMAGRRAQGMTIRVDLMRLGGCMRAECPSLAIGSLVGIAVSATARARPGGAKPLSANLAGDEMARQQLDAFVKYARAAGFPDAASLAEAENTAGIQARDIVKAGMAQSPVMGVPMFMLILHWIVGLVLLSNILWFLCVGAGAALLAHLRGAGWAVALIVFSAFAALVMHAISQSRWGEALAAIASVVQNLTSGSDGEFGFPPTWARFVMIGGTLVLPVLVTLGALLVASVSRIPSAASLRSAALGTGALLLILYAWTATLTLRGEHQTNLALDRSLTGEGRYFAEILGKPWPSPPK